MQSFLLAVLVAVAVFAYTHAETTCESHRRNSQSSVHGLKWKIECDSEGYYKPLQCTDEAQERKRWCACYNKEEAITSPSRKMRHCACPLAADEARNSNSNECDVPNCTNTGMYQSKQCCPSTGKCHCVNTETGERTTEPSTDRNLQCPA